MNHIFWETRSEELYVLNLDKEFNPFRNHEKICYIDFDKSTFLGGEPHFKLNINEIHGPVIITQRVDSVEDLMYVVIANDALRRLGAKEIHLFMPYFPAARQDRICNKGEAFTLKIFADMINNCGFEEVTILTPHSDVTPALINNVNVMDDHPIILGAVEILGGADINIVCPDAGAGKRVQKAIEYISNNNPTNRRYHLVRCEKIRDVKDGKLKEFYVGDGLVQGAPTIILDDINCMGGTFLGLGEKLREAGCGKLALYTAHSDCQAGIEKVRSFFDHIFTTNSKKNNANQLMFDNITCINLKF